MAMPFGPYSPFRPLILSSVDGTLRTESDSRTGTGHRTLPLDAKSLLSSESPKGAAKAMSPLSSE